MNKVEIISRENKTQVIIDGIKVKGLQSVKFQRDVSDPRATLEIRFKCDLTTENFKPDDLPEQIRDYRLKKTDP